LGGKSAGDGSKCCDDLGDEANGHQADSSVNTLAKDLTCPEFQQMSLSSNGKVGSDIESGMTVGNDIITSDYFMDIPHILLTLKDGEPRNQYTVLGSQYEEEWLIAEQNEFEALQKCDTWEIVDLPHDRVALPHTMVYKMKTNHLGVVVKYKARLCVRGDIAQEGIDYHETFAPVSRLESIRLFLALTVLWGLQPDQSDVDNAYVNAPLREEVYMTVPTRLKNVPRGKVLKLKKALYGLPQSGREWNHNLHDSLVAFGLNRLQGDYGLYIKKKDNGDVMIVSIYVDDIYVASSKKSMNIQFNKYLQTHYSMKNLGVPKELIGIKLDWETDENGNHIAVKLSISKIIVLLAAEYL
jgi:hypothetical protein